MKYAIITSLLFLFCLNVLSAQDGETVFDNAIVHTLAITSTYGDNLVDSLVARHQYENATGTSWSYIQVDAHFDGVLVDSIGVRIKGGYGSFSAIKPSLKFDFNEFVADKRYDDLKKINVDNCLYDPSLMREKLYNDMANELGLCSSRTSFVKVSIDGENYGTFVYIEQVNKQFLKRCFGNKGGNLFKTSAGGDLSYYGNSAADYDFYYDLKTNKDEDDWTDLLQLIEKVNFTSDAQFQDTIAKYLNVESVLQYLAMGTYTVYSDNVFSRGNNGYWYHNTDTDKFELIAIDGDLSFMDRELYDYEYTAAHTELINPIVTRGVFGKILDIPEYRAQYLDRCCTLYNGLGDENNFKAQIDFYNTALESADIIPDANTAYTSFSNNNIFFIQGYTFLGLKDFIEKRHTTIQAELAGLSVICDNVDGIDRPDDLANTNVYPNPASQSFFIDNRNEIDEITIFDMFGREVLAVLPTQNEVRIDGLVSGLYVVQFSKNGKKCSRKIIID